MDRTAAGEFRHALLSGDPDAVKAFLQGGRAPSLLSVRNDVLREITQGVLDGSVPFCQLVAVCQAAQPLYDPAQSPIACCGSLSGEASFFTQRFMTVLLQTWGIPVLDLGLNTSPEIFLDAVLRYHLRFVLCTAFTEKETELLLRIDEKAKALGIREHISLMLGGIRCGTTLPIDNTDHRTLAIVREVAEKWKE